MSDEVVLTHRGTNPTEAQRKLCKCHLCGTVARCTPWFDFYGEEGDPLLCEICHWKTVVVPALARHTPPAAVGQPPHPQQAQQEQEHNKGCGEPQGPQGEGE